MLRFTDVSKRFGAIVAVDGLTLAIEPGEIYGLLGPNGAGKSTSVNLAVGLLRPDSGTVELAGHGSPVKNGVRGVIGVATQALAIYEDLTGEENLRFFGRLYGLHRGRLEERVSWALDFVGLSDRRQDLVKTYSGGMKRRVNLAAALLHEPKLILLDEPTVGVDPQSRNSILERVVQLKEQGRTVVYTTHYMEEAQRLCDRVGIMDHGKLLVSGPIDQLVADHGGPITVVAETDNGQIRIEAQDMTEALHRLEESGRIRNFSAERPSLETVFLNLTGRSLRD